MKFLRRLVSQLGRASKTSELSDYETAKLQEIENYRYVENIHDLPEIYHYWSNKFLSPLFEKSGFSGIDEFFAKYLAEGLRSKSRLLSIGSGLCDTEVRITLLLRKMGFQDFTFECLELNPALIERGRELASKEGVADHMIFTEADFNEWKPKTSYSGIMANHSLHHVVNLEDLFDGIKNCLDSSANFVVNDMIGRNGHQCWPEALTVVDQFWKELPETYQYNHQLKTHNLEFTNWDCSLEGFEGIRAQDILPLLLGRFNFKYFFGFANVITPFIDRGFGHNFDSSSEWDKSFIDRVHDADESGFHGGTLKPTQMLAVMTNEQISSSLYVRGLSPQMSVRRVTNS